MTKVKIAFLMTCMAAFVLSYAEAKPQSNASSSASSSTDVSAGRQGAQVNQSSQTDTSVKAGREGQHPSSAGVQSHGSSDTNASVPSGKAGGNKAGGKTTGETGQLSSGTAMTATLSQAVDAKKCKPGDEITAKTTQAVRSGHEVVIPKGSKLIGHVTEAKARGQGQSESVLGIAFDRAVLKNGQSMPINTSIQAIAAANNAANVAGDSSEMMGSMGSEVTGSGRGSMSGPPSRGAMGGVGAVGGVTGAVGGAAGTAGSTVSNTANAAGGVSGAAGHAGGAAGGTLRSTSSGVIGLPGLTLSNMASNAASVAGSATTGVPEKGAAVAGTASGSQATLIRSSTRNVKLDSGTQLLLTVAGSAQ